MDAYFRISHYICDTCMQIADIYAMLILKNINDTVEKLIQEDKALTDGNLNLYSIRLALHQNFAEFLSEYHFILLRKISIFALQKSHLTA